MAEPAKRGRPTVAPEDFKKRRDIRFSDKEWERINKLASKKGVKASEFIRDAVKEYDGR